MNAADTLRKIVALISSGISASDARAQVEAELQGFTAAQRKHFEAIYSLAVSLGGAVTGALSRLAEVFEAAARAQHQMQVAFAAPRSTARLVAWLPMVSLGMGQLVGLGPIGAIKSSIAALLSVVLGAGLLAGGHLWSKRILAAAAPAEHDPGALLEAVAIGLQAGLPLIAARDRAGEVFELEPTHVAVLDEAAELTRQSGASLTNILLTRADQLRARFWFESETKIAKLSVRLMVPLGIAVLPAFVLLAIVPIAIGLLSNRQF